MYIAKGQIVSRTPIHTSKFTEFLIPSAFALLYLYRKVYPMQGSVSVQQALKKGDRMITHRGYAVFIVIYFPLFLVINAYCDGLRCAALLFSGFFVTSFIVDFYKNHQIAKWRTWAFANVAEVDELTAAAITEGFVLTSSSWFEKLFSYRPSEKEISTAVTLPGEEQTNDMFNDDLALGPAIDIVWKYDSKYLFLTAGFIGFVAVLAFAFALNLAGFLIALPILALSIWLYKCKALTGKKVQVTLNNHGIESVKYGFRKWSSITDPKIISVENSEGEEYYLQYGYADRKEMISLKFMDVNNRELNHLIYIYYNRGRLANGK